MYNIFDDDQLKFRILRDGFKVHYVLQLGSDYQWIRRRAFRTKQRSILTTRRKGAY